MTRSVVAATVPIPEQDARLVRSETYTRIERKLFVDPLRLRFTRAWLGHACRPAPEYSEGQVTSVYFDSRDLDQYFASADGDMDKNKVRLRWYDSLPVDGDMMAFLELKSKQGMETAKRRIPVSVPARALADEDFAAALPGETLRRLLFGLGYAPPLDLRPAVVVTYYRYRFVEPQSEARMSLDSDIRVRLTDGRPQAPVRLEAAVLELKSRDLEVPLVLRGLERIAPVWSAFSKYAAAVEALAGGPGAFRA